MNQVRPVHDGVLVKPDRDLVLVGSQNWRDAVMPPSADGFPKIADKLTWIINTIPTADGRRLTPERLARSIIDQTNGDFQVTAGHLQALKSGVRDNPSARLLMEISRAAGLPPAFFWSDVADHLIREVVQRAIEDHDQSMAPYDALLADAVPGLTEAQLEKLRGVLLAVMGASESADPTP